MKTTKFRALVNGRMVYQTGALSKMSRFWQVVEYDKEAVVMQFTGLHDKNGKEIYEKDIVKHNGHILENPLLISFLDGAFCIGMKGIRDNNFESFITIRDAMCMATDYNTELEIEVIGNIYEKSELLSTNL